MNTFSIMIAAASTITASAALAAPSAGSTEAAAVAGSASAPVQAETIRYCVTETPTGSRIPRRQCQTRTEWENHGVDILALAQ